MGTFAARGCSMAKMSYSISPCSEEGFLSRIHVSTMYFDKALSAHKLISSHHSSKKSSVFACITALHAFINAIHSLSFEKILCVFLQCLFRCAKYVIEYGSLGSALKCLELAPAHDQQQNPLEDRCPWLIEKANCWRVWELAFLCHENKCDCICLMHGWALHKSIYWCTAPLNF